MQTNTSFIDKEDKFLPFLCHYKYLVCPDLTVSR